MRTLTLGFAAILCACLGLPPEAVAQDTLTLGTWNIEHLGTGGRGFGGGFGAGSLPRRTDAQLQEIARFIEDTVQADVLALQEIAITRVVEDVSRSAQLDTIVTELGDGWAYFLPSIADVPTDANNLFNAILWNGNRVNRLNTFAMDLPDDELAGEPLFKRQPVVGYFEALRNGQGTNDFVMVGVHLASGQTNDENHLIAMVLLEHGLSAALAAHEVQESDRIILGDFNDNPYATSSTGRRRFSNALYTHMEFKRYEDLVTEDFHSTRMDDNLTSVIDHVLVNSSVRLDMPSPATASIFLPGNGDSATFGAWRGTFSDHFPISFTLNVRTSDTDVDFDGPDQ